MTENCYSAVCQKTRKPFLRVRGMYTLTLTTLRYSPEQCSPGATRTLVCARVLEMSQHPSWGKGA